MAKEHHCPNCGPQVCNASSSTIHVCPICVTRWAEVLEDEKRPAPPAAAPTAPA